MDRVRKFLELTLLTITVAFAACGLIAIISLSPLLKDASGWMQAFGAVLAIFGTYHLAERGFVKSRAQEKVTRLEREIQTIETVQAVTARATSMTKLMHERLEKAPDRVLRTLRATKFQRELDLIDSLPPLEIPDARIAMLILHVNPNMMTVIGALKKIEKRSMHDNFDQAKAMADVDLALRVEELYHFLLSFAKACNVAIGIRREEIARHQ